MKTIPAIFIACIIAFAFISSSEAAPGDIILGFPTPGRCPTGLAFDGKHLWLADRLSDTLCALEPSSGKTVKKLPAPGFIPLGLAWDGEHLWCLDGEEKRIHQLDLKSGVTLKSLEVTTSRPQGLAWDGKYLWLSDDRDDIVTQLSTEDGTTIISFPSPSGSPQGLAWDGKYLWCADRIRDRIYMIEVNNGEVLLSIEAPGKYARGLAYVDGYLWNADYQADSLFKLVVDDGIQIKTSDSKMEELFFTHEFRNYGPGKVETLDAFFALPKNRPNQKIIGEIIFEPEPTDFVHDRWGQRFARFRLKNLPLAERIRATMTITAELSDARWFIFPHKVGSREDIPKEIREKYLVDEDKYRITDPIIQKAASEAVGGEENPYGVMRKVYKYVRDHMHYELAGGWNVAPAVLERGNGSCSEYSFVFIAICRAAGLPTRYVGSVALRGDDASTDDVFHRWCECYLPGYGWVPIDPSGGDRENPADVAEYFGHVANRYLITTEGGGASEYLGWGYNSNEFWTARGPVKIHVESVGEWSPVE